MKLASTNRSAILPHDLIMPACKSYRLMLFCGLVVSIFLTDFASSLFAATPCTLTTQQEEPTTVPLATRPRPLKFSKPAIIEFKGEINRKLKTYFDNRFAASQSAGVDLLIIEIDSPGGLRDESLEMAKKLRDCDAYTVAIISNEAISGGALVSLGCDEIMIDPNATFGDIGEIEFNQATGVLRLIEPKINSYLAVNARAIAESKGRSPDLAEALVDRNVLVYVQAAINDPDAPQDAGGENENEFAEGQAKPASQLRFTSVRAEALIKPDAPWKLVPESRAERYLTLTGQRAVELEIAQGHEHSRELMAKEFGFSMSQVQVYQPTLTDSVVYLLNSPIMTGLLVLIGLIALYIEFSAPGISVGGLLAGLCAVLFFWSRFLGGTSGWLEVILFLAGIIFLFTEVFVLPGFGFSGLTGLALLFSSVILAGQDFVLPQTAEQWNQSLTSMLILISASVGFLMAAVFISKRMGSIPIFNKMILSPPPIETNSESNKDGKPIVQDHPHVAVGDWGQSESLLRPAGRAKFAGRSFDVISDGAFVESGTQVRVIKIKGNIITVSAVSDDH